MVSAKAVGVPPAFPRTGGIDGQLTRAPVGGQRVGRGGMTHIWNKRPGQSRTSCNGGSQGPERRRRGIAAS